MLEFPTNKIRDTIYSLVRLTIHYSNDIMMK